MKTLFHLAPFAIGMANLLHAADANSPEKSSAPPPDSWTQSSAKPDLSGDWSFAYTPATAATVPEASLFLAKMPVPGAWDDTLDINKASALWPAAKSNKSYKPIAFPYSSKPPDASLPYLLGTGWYRRSLDVPMDWKERAVTLHVGQVVTEATVFVNGIAIHTHRGHNTEWEVALAPHLRYGASNDLVIAVSNTENLGGCRLRGWPGATGGIFAPVSLKVAAGPVRVASLYAYPESADLHWNVSLEGHTAPAQKLEWAVLDDGRSILNGSVPVTSSDVVWKTPSAGMIPWSDRDPKLYELAVKLTEGGKIVDEVRQRFGLRRLVPDGRALKLNGEPVYLRGHCEHCYFPETCTPALDLATYLKRLTMLKKLGFNWLRFHTWFPTEPYLEAADELGFMISIEGQDGMSLEMWRDVVRAGRTHPSVVIYCLGNEQLFDEKKIGEAAQLAREQKRLAPDGLFSPNSGERGIIRSTKEDGDNNGFGAGYSATPFPHNPRRLAAVNQFCDLWQPHIWGDLSYQSLRAEWPEIERRLQVMTRPALVHEAGITGSYLDLTLGDRYKNTRIGPVLYDAAREYLRKRGVLDRAPLYYANSVAWQNLIRKDMLETTRHCQSVVGYDLLGAVDMHWHRTGYEVGILNEFFELKSGVTVADILSCNGESVLLIDDQRERILSAGKRTERELKVSWYGRKPVANGRLRWSLKGQDGSSIDSGEWAVGPVQPGTVAPLGKVGFTAPKADQPKKLRLAVALSDGSGTIANHWDYWIFPPVPRVPESPQLVIAKKLDGQILEKLAGGARVVLLGGEPLPQRALSFQQGIGGRPENNFATVIEKHPITDAFPHDGYFDWQFFRMAHNANSVVFDALPVPFKPIIDVANSYKQVILQSPLFEWQVGKGRLIVCTLNLDEKRSEAAYFKALILRYAAGPDLVAAPAMSTSDLASLMKRPSAPVRKLDGDDQGLDPRVLGSKARARSQSSTP